MERLLLLSSLPKRKEIINSGILEGTMSSKNTRTSRTFIPGVMKMTVNWFIQNQSIIHALQIYDLPPIITYPDISFEQILEIAVHYWHSTDASRLVTQLYNKLTIPNATNENFNITILLHTYFTGTLDYNESHQ